MTRVRETARTRRLRRGACPERSRRARLKPFAIPQPRGGRKCMSGKTSPFVELVLPDPVGYRSNSQRARVATEAWVTKNLYCPACPSPDLEPTPTGHPVADFACPRCGEEYQLKSKRGHLGARMTDAAYSEALRATERNAFPHLLLMQYVEIPTSHPESRPGDVQRSGNPAAD